MAYPFEPERYSRDVLTSKDAWAKGIRVTVGVLVGIVYHLDKRVEELEQQVEELRGKDHSPGGG